MRREFEYTFEDFDITVMVTIDYSTYTHWLDETYKETHVHHVEIMYVTCGKWDIMDTLKQHAPAGTWRELEDAAWEFAVED